jgi:hypothetical protein
MVKWICQQAVQWIQLRSLFQCDFKNLFDLLTSFSFVQLKRDILLSHLEIAMIKPDGAMQLCTFQISAQKEWNLLLHSGDEAIHQSSDLIYSNYVPLTGTSQTQ